RKNTPASTTSRSVRRRPSNRMPKGKSVYRCTECGADQPKWAGRCDSCGTWNSLVEESLGRTGGGVRTGRIAPSPSDSQPVRLSDVSGATLSRFTTGLGELDFVLGGGI